MLLHKHFLELIFNFGPSRKKGKLVSDEKKKKLI